MCGSCPLGPSDIVSIVRPSATPPHSCCSMSYAGPRPCAPAPTHPRSSWAGTFPPMLRAVPLSPPAAEQTCNPRCRFGSTWCPVLVPLRAPPNAPSPPAREAVSGAALPLDVPDAEAAAGAAPGLSKMDATEDMATRAATGGCGRGGRCSMRDASRRGQLVRVFWVTWRWQLFYLVGYH